MALNICIIFLLIAQNWVVADNNLNTGNAVTGQAFFIVGIVLTSFFVTIGLLLLSCYTLKCVKRKMSEPQYYVDDIPVEKDNNDYPNENNYIDSQITHINQIQPILTVSEIVSSIKQSMIDLRVSLVPFSWSDAQRRYDQQNPVKEKMDLPL